MNLKDLDEKELLEILTLAKEGEKKLKEMSCFATMISEKWQRKAEIQRAFVKKNNTLK